MVDLRKVINNPARTPEDRLEALRAAVEAEEVARGEARGEVNNHVHTVFSFSPYTPTMAVLMAAEAGLDAVGSVDHDSVGAARETVEAGAIVGLATTVGFEVRVSFAGTPFADRRINFPECRGKAYMVVHGLPQRSVAAAEAFLAPLRRARVERTRRMTERLSAVLTKAGLPALDFATHVAPLTQWERGGGVTERHLLAAAADLLAQAWGRGQPLLDGLSAKLGVPVPPKVGLQLTDTANPHARYDLIGLLKTTLIGQAWIDPGPDECPPVREVTAFARSLGALPAYPYLGDVGESPTGDKKAETYEDAYLDELVAALPGLGFLALTYMPPRNTVEQLTRVQRLAAAQGLLEISGVDINSSRQSFHCPEVLLPPFRHLNESTWALIAHEKLADLRPGLGLFDAASPLAGRPLAERIAAFARSGRALDPRQPQTVQEPRP